MAESGALASSSGRPIGSPQGYTNTNAHQCTTDAEHAHRNHMRMCAWRTHTRTRAHARGCHDAMMLSVLPALAATSYV